MLEDDVQRIALDGHLQRDGLVLQVVELRSADPGGGVEIDEVELLAELHVVQRLEVEDRRLADELDGGAVLVFLADRGFRVRVVRNGAGLGQVFGVQILLFLLDLGDLVLQFLALGDQALAGFGIQLALHLLGDFVASGAEPVGFRHGGASLVAQGDDGVQVHPHVAVLDVGGNLVVPGLQLFQVNHGSSFSLTSSALFSRCR